MHNQENILHFLKKRGFIHYISDILKFKILLKNHRIFLYCGFDPTEDSLHVGHLLPIICLKYFQIFGHQPFVVIGGATSLIGDPSFKKKERKKLNSEFILYNQNSIEKQLQIFFTGKNIIKNNVIFLNNLSWFKDFSCLSFLEDVGSYFSVNKMIQKESVKKRLFQKKTGISFSEFSYSLLQAYDFLILHKKYNVNLQIGGSDQWGNIAAGIHLIRRIYKKLTFGLTIPLLINSNGEKFGKTEGNTIWLNKKKTSPYKFYQFWLNIEDNKVNNFLRLFTFLKNKELDELVFSEDNIVNLLEKKKILADHVTEFVHGKKYLISAQRITKFFFSKLKNFNSLTEKDFYYLFQDGIPSILCKNFIFLTSLLLKVGFSTSLSHSKRLILFGSIRINNKIQNKLNYSFNNSDKIFKKYTLLSKGKKNHILIMWKK